MNCLNTMVNFENDRNRRWEKADRQFDIERQRRIEREKQNHENRVARNNDFVNKFYEKKRNEQRLYSDIDKLISINLRIADAYVDVVTKVKG